MVVESQLQMSEEQYQQQAASTESAAGAAQDIALDTMTTFATGATRGIDQCTATGPVTCPAQENNVMSLPRKIASNEWSSREATEIGKKLKKQLGPEFISSRAGPCGTRMQFMEGWRAIELANEIFGFNGWSSELVSTQIDLVSSSLFLLCGFSTNRSISIELLDELHLLYCLSLCLALC